MDRAAVDAEDLLKVVLVLVIVWLALEVLDRLLHIAFGLLGLFRPFLAVLVLALIVLFLLDRI
ncbi:MAG: hypothetical protein ABEJ81_01285 [Haloferacaceae archaeon]